MGWSLEEEDGVCVLGLEAPPLAHARRLFGDESLGDVERARVVVLLLRPPLLPVPAPVPSPFCPRQLDGWVRNRISAGRRKARPWCSKAAPSPVAGAGAGRDWKTERKLLEASLMPRLGVLAPAFCQRRSFDHHSSSQERDEGTGVGGGFEEGEGVSLSVSLAFS